MEKVSNEVEALVRVYSLAKGRGWKTALVSDARDGRLNARLSQEAICAILTEESRLKLLAR